MRAAKTAKRGYLGRGGFNALTGLTAEPTAAWRRKSSWYRNETKRDKRKKKLCESSSLRGLHATSVITFFLPLDKQFLRISYLLPASTSTLQFLDDTHVHRFAYVSLRRNELK